MLQRVEILRGLRLGEFDVLVGINLLREGLDLPEVSLVAILDADKEGFLRDERSLIQTAGRAARNVRGQVLLYADTLTRSIRAALAETDRRRRKQVEYNVRHGIKPRSITKSLDEVMTATSVADGRREPEEADEGPETTGDRLELLAKLQRRMEEASAELRFEDAAEYRDRIRKVLQNMDEDMLRRAPKAAGGRPPKRRGRR